MKIKKFAEFNKINENNEYIFKIGDCVETTSDYSDLPIGSTGYISDIKNINQYEFYVVVFIDLDNEFCRRIQNIGIYIRRYGYEKYCYENSKLFYKLLDENEENVVFALSSGFLVYENLEKLTLKHKLIIKKTGHFNIITTI